MLSKLGRDAFAYAQTRYDAIGRSPEIAVLISLAECRWQLPVFSRKLPLSRPPPSRFHRCFFSMLHPHFMLSLCYALSQD